MVSSIVAFWRECDSMVHPADAELLSSKPSIFNLDYPPPAYVGDIDNARVVLLNGNGGYDSVMTPAEYPDTAARSRAINRLHYPGPIEPSEVSPYYAACNYAKWLRSGELALVNALPYRSINITTEVRQVARSLPSSMRHKRWLTDEVFPDAQKGNRLVIAHRYALWGGQGHQYGRSAFHVGSRRPKLSQCDDQLNRGFSPGWRHVTGMSSCRRRLISEFRENC